MAESRTVPVLLQQSDSASLPSLLLLSHLISGATATIEPSGIAAAGNSAAHHQKPQRGSDSPGCQQFTAATPRARHHATHVLLLSADLAMLTSNNSASQGFVASCMKDQRLCSFASIRWLHAPLSAGRTLQCWAHSRAKGVGKFRYKPDSIAVDFLQLSPGQGQCRSPVSCQLAVK